jgi:hypothetical protein
MQPAPNTEALDQQFKEFIQGLKGAVNSAMPHLKDDQQVVDKAIPIAKRFSTSLWRATSKSGWLSDSLPFAAYPSFHFMTKAPGS